MVIRFNDMDVRYTVVYRFSAGAEGVRFRI